MTNKHGNPEPSRCMGSDPVEYPALTHKQCLCFLAGAAVVVAVVIAVVVWWIN